MFKQFLQADAIGFCQIDSCRLGGVNEVLAVLLMAAKFGVPVCPHAGGVGLCEYVQHLAIFDYIAVSGSLEDRVVEYVDHLHEHFVAPAIVRDGRYVAPTAPGLQHHDAAGVAGAVRVPRRRGLDAAPSARVAPDERPARGQGLPDHGRRVGHRPGVALAVRRRGGARRRRGHRPGGRGARPPA